MYSRMASITQDMRYHLPIIKYTNNFGVTKAAMILEFRGIKNDNTNKE